MKPTCTAIARPTLVAMSLLAALPWVALRPERAAAQTPTPAVAPDTGQDPRNWPTVTRLIGDRYEQAGQVFTLRVYAKKSDYFNCGYAGTEGRLMAFTLLGGPFETLTGYLPAELGKVLERLLAGPEPSQVAEQGRGEPSYQITVQVSFDPDRLSDVCLDQVDILKWSRGWQYPPNTLAPGRPDPTRLPTVERLKELAAPQIWKELTDPEAAPIGQQVQLAGGARLSTAMHCAYRGAWRTHWALQLHDGRGRVLNAYVPKSDKARELVDHLALHRDAPLALQARVVKVAMSTYCEPQLEVVGWTLADLP